MHEAKLLLDVVGLTEEEFADIKNQFEVYLEDYEKLDSSFKQNILSFTDTLYKKVYKSNCVILSEDIYDCRKFIVKCFNKSNVKRLEKLRSILDQKLSKDLESFNKLVAESIDLSDDCIKLLDYFEYSGLESSIDDIQKEIILNNCN